MTRYNYCPAAAKSSLSLVARSGRVSYWLIFVLMSAMLLGCTDTPEDKARVAAEHLRLAEFYLSQGSLRSAVIETRNSQQAMPDSAETKLLLSRIFLKAGDGRSAERELMALRDAGVTSPAIGLALAQSRLLQNNPVGAVDELNKLGELTESESEESGLLRGKALLMLNDVDGAAAILGALAANNPESAKASVALATVAAARGDSVEVDRLLEKALKSEPDNIDAWLWRARMATLKEDWPAAEESYARVRDLDGTDILTPRKMEAVNGVVKAKTARQNFEEAYRYYEDFLELYPNTVLADYERGLAHLRQGETERAEETLKEILEMVPEHQPSTLLLGMISFSRNDFSTAERYLAAYLTSLDNADARVVKAFAVTKLRLNKPEEALEALSTLLKREPEDAEAMALVGLAKFTMGDTAEGLKLLKNSVALKPDDPKIRTDLGRMYLSLNQGDKAIAEFEEVLNAVPDSQDARGLLLAALLRENEMERADKIVDDWYAENSAKESSKEAMYQRVLSVGRASNKLDWSVTTLENLAAGNKDSVLAHHVIAKFFVENGDAQKSVNHAMKALEKHSDAAPARLTLGRAYLALENWKAAAKAFQQYIAAAPDDAGGYYYLAVAKFQQQDFVAAEKFAQQALSQNSDFVPATVLLTEIYVSKGDFKAASEDASYLRQSRPDLAIGYVLEGDLFSAEEKYSAAVEAYQEALRVEPSAGALLKLVSALRRSGQSAEILPALRTYVDANPNDLAGKRLLADQLLNDGLYDEAVTNFEELNRRARFKDAAVLNNLAWLYGMKGDPRAIELAREALALAPNSGSIMDTLGWLLSGEGEHNEAIPLLEEALSRRPENADIREHLAISLERAGRPEDAEEIRRGEIVNR